MKPETESTPSAELTAELSMLRTEVESLNARLHTPLPRLFGLQVLRGIAFGLGSVLGATLLVSILVFSLASIDFVPIIGEWAKEIANTIRQP